MVWLTVRRMTNLIQVLKGYGCDLLLDKLLDLPSQEHHKNVQRNTHCSPAQTLLQTVCGRIQQDRD